MTQWLRNVIMLVAMVAASGLATAIRPHEKVADLGPKINLELMFPREAGEWREVKFNSGQIVDPVQKATLDKIYNQTLSRAYVNPQGYVIMLSVAYGSDQSDSMQMHLPDLCYPAQGFQLNGKEVGTLDLPSGAIPATRLKTFLGNRKEPLTYWSTIGDKVVVGGIQKKLAEMRYGITGKIADGMLVRVSSVDPDAPRAYKLQAQFAEAMVGAMAVSDRARVVGAPKNN